MAKQIIEPACVPLPGTSVQKPGTPPRKIPPRTLSVLILDCDGHHSQSVASCLGQVPGLKLHVLSNRSWVAVRFSRYATTFGHYPAFAGDELRLNHIHRAIIRSRADALLAVTEPDVRFLGYYRESLQNETAIASVVAPKLLDMVANKYALNLFLAKCCLPNPRTVLFTSLADVEKSLNQLRFPLLLKPIVGGGGIGIKRFNTAPELLSSLKKNPPPMGSCILQQLIHGQDFDCSVLCRDGQILAHTIQRPLLPRRHPFGRDHALKFVHHDAVYETISQLMQALRWNGIANLDVLWDEEARDVKVVDFNPRYWTSLLGSLAAGVNFPYLACLDALGIEFPAPRFRHLNYFMAGSALKRLPIGREEPFITALPYVFEDPGPRLFNLAKRLFV